MKIRILNNTIRLRLKQPEVSQFQQSGKVLELLEFGPLCNDQLSFSLEISSSNDVRVNFQSNTITILVPKALAEKWAATDLVGFNGTVDTGKGKMIRVMVEKDFLCMDGAEEENEGSYPNPLMHQGL